MPIPTKTATHDPAWRETYAQRVATADAAVARLRPGQRVFIGTGCAEPLELVRALTRRAGELADVEIVHLLTFGEAPYAHEELTRTFRVNSFFIAENVRDTIQQGLGDYTPVFLSDIPHLFASGQLPLDVALIHTTPPDEHGMCSLGVSVDVVKSAAENAALVIAQVNPLMPRTLGNSSLHIDVLDVLVPVEEPIPEIAFGVESGETEQIAEHVSALIDDGATLELGIGAVPQSLLRFLKGKKDLGIHTEMLSDGVVELVETGVITGACKTLDPGLVVTSFCLGTRKLYDYVADNPVFSFQSTEYVNDPFIISQQHKMVAINMALEVDLTGQVCADSLGARFFSGVGGQVDFNRGAARAHGGKAIIALPSTAKDGKVSRIVAQLSPGAGVVTTRADVHYVVTEHGIAYLHGKTVQERALALITIAHTDFRAALLHAAIEAKYVSADHAAIEGKIFVGPKEQRTTCLLPDGSQIVLRPINPTDEPRIRHLFYELSQQTIYYRFMSHLKRISHRQVQDFVYVDHRNDVTIVATLPDGHGEDILAIGCYYLDPQTNRAEVAFVVRDDWQGHGIGKLLFDHLAKIARRQGIRGFTAEVLRDNPRMQRVFGHSGFKLRSQVADNVISYEMDFEATGGKR